MDIDGYILLLEERDDLLDISPPVSNTPCQELDEGCIPEARSRLPVIGSVALAGTIIASKYGDEGEEAD